VGNRRISDKPLYVRLDHRNQCAIDDADDRQYYENVRVLMALLREQIEVKAHQSIRAHF